MIWWRPTYPAPSYTKWHENIDFGFMERWGHELATKHFLVSRFPEPSNDRDSIRW